MSPAIEGDLDLKTISERTAAALALLTLPALGYSAGYVQYLGYPIARVLGADDLVNISLSLLTVAFVLGVPIVGVALYSRSLSGRSRMVIAAGAALAADLVLLTSLVRPALQGLENWAVAIIAAAAGFALFALVAWFVQSARPARQFVYALGALCLCAFVIGYCKGHADFWRRPTLLIPHLDEAAVNLPVNLMYRNGDVCIFRRQCESELTVSNACSILQVAPGEFNRRRYYSIMPAPADRRGGAIDIPCVDPAQNSPPHGHASVSSPPSPVNSPAAP